MIKGQEQNQNLIEDRLPIRTEDKKRKTSFKGKQVFSRSKRQSCKKYFFCFFGFIYFRRLFVFLLPLI